MMESKLPQSVSSGSSVPVWYDFGVKMPKGESLTAPVHSDVVIVGAGIAGLSCAYTLLGEGKSVSVIEDGEICSGETGRTTAHLMSWCDDHFRNVADHHGIEAAKIAYQSHAAAIDKIESIVKVEGIDCDFSRVDGYLIKEHRNDEHGMRIIQRELETAKAIGVPGVEIVHKAPLPLGNFGAALRVPNQGQFHILKYCAGLAEAIIRRGGKLYTNTHADQINGSKSGASVVTTGGVEVTASDVIVTTNVPVINRVTLLTKMSPMRSYVVGFRIAKGSVPRALFWDTCDPYHYARIVDGPEADSDTLLVGGEDHVVGREHDHDTRFRHLMEWAQLRFPIGEITYRWSGQIIEPLDDMQFIGRNPGDSKNVFVATADSGQGITGGTLAGMLINDMIMHRALPTWQALYDPSRMMTSEKLDFIKHNLETNMQYKDYLKPGDVKDIEDIKPDSGCTMRHGLTDIRAVYKAADGTVYECSAVCPHLGAIVNWNDLEKTWDCPAHGSRFDKFGNVINGPTKHDLNRIEGRQGIKTKTTGDRTEPPRAQSFSEAK